MNFTIEQLQQIIQEEAVNTLEERCWDGYERVPGKKKGELGSCRKQTNESDLNEDDEVKKDACYKKIKAAVKAKKPPKNKWPSAYASGRLVQCRKKGAANWKEGEPKKEGKQSSEDAKKKKGLHGWFARQGAPGPEGGWVDCNAPRKDGKYAECAQGDRKKKPYCRPTPSACKTEPQQNESRKRVVKVRIAKSSMKEAEITDKEKKELEDVTDQLDAAVIAHGNQSKTIKKAIKKEGKKNCGCGQDPCKTYGIQEQVVNEEELEEKKKKKACKPTKGKRYAERGSDGKCRSYGQAGKSKKGGDRIQPGTAKGHAYCARSAKIPKCDDPPCPNDLSRKKWHCKGDRSEPD